MNVSELFRLTVWITENVVKNSVVQKYQDLFTVIQINAQVNQPKRPFEAQKNDLLTTLNAINKNELTQQQLEYLKQLKIYHYIGDEGVNLIENNLYKNSLDIVTCAANIQKAINDINAGLKISDILQKCLGKLDLEEEYESDNEIMMRVAFKNQTYISNFTELKKWGGIWYEIVYGIAMANDTAPEEIKIVGATKGSVILELVAIAAIVKIISSILMEGLKVVDKVLEIRKKAEEIRALKIKNDKAAQELEQEAESEKQIGIDKIISVISDQLKIDKTKSGDKVAALSQSILKLLDFIEKGGEIDFVIPEKQEAGDDEEISTLKVAFSEIRRLENKILLLEQKS
jgi:hypothetical protein